MTKPGSRIELPNTQNFRDLGGYKTSDGREVLHGHIFRSDTPSKIGKDQVEMLKKQYKVKQIIDFRAHDEALRAPYKFDGIKRVSISIDPVHTFVTSLSEVHGRPVEVADVRKASDRISATYLEDYAKDLRKFFHILLSSKGEAIIFHCTAGKDRTGIAAALFLSLLDVNKEDILADYLLSNQYLKCSIDDGKPHNVLGSNFTAEAVHELCSVSESNLRHALRPAIENYGSIKNYAKKKLDLSDRDLKKLKKYYTKEIPPSS